MPVAAPQVVTQYGTQYVRTTFQEAGVCPVKNRSPWFIAVKIVPTIRAVKLAFFGVPSLNISCDIVGVDMLVSVLVIKCPVELGQIRKCNLIR